MSPDRLDLRALNRATLARQLLLDRAPLTVLDAVGHLAGLQAQAPLAPYVGLWTRLAGFRHQHLKDLMTERAVLRAHLMRNTVHLVDAADFVRFRPLYQPRMERALAGKFGRNLVGVDLAELGATAAALLGETPLTRAELGARLAPRWPDHDPAALAYAAGRVIPHRRPVPLPPGHGGCGGTLLVGGWWQADWKISQGILQIRPFSPLSAADRDAIVAEGERLLGFAASATAVRDVRFAPVRSG